MKSTPASICARRVGVSLILCVLVQTMAPTPAQAWFGWLDKWSGPGDFWGALYEVRLACFGDPSGIPQARDAHERARRLSRLALGSLKDGEDLSPSAFDSVLLSWMEALLLVEAVQIRWHARETDRSSIKALLNSSLRGLADPKEFASTGMTLKQSLTTFGEMADLAVQQAVPRTAGQVVTAGGTGVFWSLCSDQKERRVSIELNVNDWHGFDNENNRAFSDGHTVRLITVMPSLTWNVIRNRKADVLDISIGGGFYAFSSKGFDTVRGFIVQPIRIDVHAPTAWAGYEWSDTRRWLSLLTFRWGLVSVPSGFAADAFADGTRAERIPAEFVHSLAVFGNLNSLLSNPRKKRLPPTRTQD